MRYCEVLCPPTLVGISPAKGRFRHAKVADTLIVTDNLQHGLESAFGCQQIDSKHKLPVSHVLPRSEVQILGHSFPDHGPCSTASATAAARRRRQLSRNGPGGNKTYTPTLYPDRNPDDSIDLVAQVARIRHEFI